VKDTFFWDVATCSRLEIHTYIISYERKFRFQSRRFGPRTIQMVAVYSFHQEIFQIYTRLHGVTHQNRVNFKFVTIFILFRIIEKRDDDVPGDVLRLIGESGFKIMTTLINTIYETGEWPKDFTDVTMIALKKKPQATKYSDHRTLSLSIHTAKIVAKILRRRIEKKIEDVLGEDQFGFRRGKGTRDAVEMLRTISERTLEIDEEPSVCFIDWQKAFDRVN